MLELLQHALAGESTGLPAVSLFVLFFFATFVSEDAACIGAGALATSGEISFGFAISACFLGIVVGDLGLYAIGRIFGRRILEFRLMKRMVSENSLSKASDWLTKRGASAVFLSRFITGLRLPTYLAAGALKTDFRKFAFYFVIAAAIWTPLLVGSVRLAGTIRGESLIPIAIGVFILIRVVLKLGDHRSRRLMIGKLKRLVKWEFWPLSVFYFPVVVYVIFLGLKHRCLTLFTCANPAISDGGFVGESKDDIYNSLRQSTDRRFLLRHRLLRGELPAVEKQMQAESFMRAEDIAFPVVLKPDAGERGKGVRIVDSYADLADVLDSVDEDYLTQEYFDGEEASIFYYRFPSALKGRIFSMTRKIFPFVTGDGKSTVEELILNDARAVCLAERYFEEDRGDLERIPDSGERIQIIKIGTHSRGAIFVDGVDMQTPELENAIDSICHDVPGFYFGRFDLRFSSLEDFMAGREFKIIELNGVTSESTNIYDPKYSLIDAWRILFEQWRLAFEIGDENRRLGIKPTPVTKLLRSALASFAPGFANRPFAKVQPESGVTRSCA